MTNLPGHWRQCQANGSNVCRVMRMLISVILLIYSVRVCEFGVLGVRVCLSYGTIRCVFFDVLGPNRCVFRTCRTKPCLRTRHTLEPLDCHWSHWPGRLVNRGGGRDLQRCISFKENVPPWDPTVALCLRPYGGTRGVGSFL